jgi:hypothetical protein
LTTFTQLLRNAATEARLAALALAFTACAGAPAQKATATTPLTGPALAGRATTGLDIQKLRAFYEARDIPMPSDLREPAPGTKPYLATFTGSGLSWGFVIERISSDGMSLAYGRSGSGGRRTFRADLRAEGGKYRGAGLTLWFDEQGGLQGEYLLEVRGYTSMRYIGSFAPVELK